jgi:hypothetical protein
MYAACMLNCVPLYSNLYFKLVSLCTFLERSTGAVITDVV